MRSVVLRSLGFEARPSIVIRINFQSLLCLYAYSRLTDACRPVLGSDALINRRTLFERSELGRSPKARVRPILMRPDGASLVLGPFAETKGPRLPGRNPAPIMNSKNSIWWNVLEMMVLFPQNQPKGNGNAYISIRRPADSSAQSKMNTGLKTFVKRSVLDKGSNPQPTLHAHFPS